MSNRDEFNKRLKNYNDIIFGNEMKNQTTKKNQRRYSNKRKLKRYENAYDTALKTRELEINLFWKRGTFFWAFITVAFVGYWSVFDKAMSNTTCNVACEAVCSISKISEIAPYYKIALCVISSIIFLFCFIFHLSIRGSKFWQANWEHHIDYLEEKNTGSLFKTFFVKEGGRLNFLEVYDFSVTKLANWVSVIMTVATAILCAATYFLCFDIHIDFFDLHSKCISRVVIVIIFIITAILVGLISVFSKGNKEAFKKLEEKDNCLLYSRRDDDIKKL